MSCSISVFGSISVITTTDHHDAEALESTGYVRIDSFSLVDYIDRLDLDARFALGSWSVHAMDLVDYFGMDAWRRARPTFERGERAFVARCDAASFCRQAFESINVFSQRCTYHVNGDGDLAVLDPDDIGRIYTAYEVDGRDGDGKFEYIGSLTILHDRGKRPVVYRGIGASGQPEYMDSEGHVVDECGYHVRNARIVEDWQSDALTIIEREYDEWLAGLTDRLSTRSIDRSINS